MKSNNAAKNKRTQKKDKTNSFRPQDIFFWLFSQKNGKDQHITPAGELSCNIHLFLHNQSNTVNFVFFWKTGREALSRDCHPQLSRKINNVEKILAALQSSAHAHRKNLITANKRWLHFEHSVLKTVSRKA